MYSIDLHILDIGFSINYQCERFKTIVTKCFRVLCMICVALFPSLNQGGTFVGKKNNLKDGPFFLECPLTEGVQIGVR